jgi:ethanolamine kinase
MLQPVAVKVFGDKTELLIDRQTELATLIKLGEAGFGAKVSQQRQIKEGKGVCQAKIKCHVDVTGSQRRCTCWLHVGQVLAVFGNGRIEEFITAMTLTPEDMAHPAFVPRIARRLRRVFLLCCSYY